MTTTQQRVKAILYTCLPRELDCFLVEHRFHRSTKSLRYSRGLAEGTQLIELCFDVSPRYVPGALAHLLPQARVRFPKLQEAVVEMVGDDPCLIGVADLTFSQQIHNAAPREVRAGAPNWIVFDQDSASECLTSMREFMQRWTIPFLNRYSTVESLARGYEEGDKCLPHDRRFWLFVAAAYTLLEQPGKAMQVLEDRFRRPGARREYAKAFDHVSALLAE